MNETELKITISSGSPEETKARLMLALLSCVRWYADSENRQIRDRESLSELTMLMESLQLEEQNVSVVI